MEKINTSLERAYESNENVIIVGKNIGEACESHLESPVLKSCTLPTEPRGPCPIST